MDGAELVAAGDALAAVCELAWFYYPDVRLRFFVTLGEESREFFELRVFQAGLDVKCEGHCLEDILPV